MGAQDESLSYFLPRGDQPLFPLHPHGRQYHPWVRLVERPAEPQLRQVAEQKNEQQPGQVCGLSAPRRPLRALLPVNAGTRGVKPIIDLDDAMNPSTSPSQWPEASFNSEYDRHKLLMPAVLEVFKKSAVFMRSSDRPSLEKCSLHLPVLSPVKPLPPLGL